MRLPPLLLIFALCAAFTINSAKAIGKYGSPLASCNGFGFALYTPKEGMVTAFQAHPTRFLAPNPTRPQFSGIEAPSLISKLQWKSSVGYSNTAAYISESHVILTDSDSNGASQSFFVPFGVNQSVLITSFLGDSSACLDIAWGNNAQKLTVQVVSGRTVGTVSFSTHGDSLALFPLDEGVTPSYDDCISGGKTWAVIGLEESADLQSAVDMVISWQAGLTGFDLIKREVESHEQWRIQAPAGLSDAELKLWRQSETIIRMAQIKQPNTETRHAYGLILASLPAGNWFIPWVRDMAYATVALIRMGHKDEAREAVRAYFEARPMGTNANLTRNIPYQISTTRYFGDGSEEADYWIDQNGVAQGRNVEFDSWGLALWVVSEYYAAYKDNDFLNSNTYRGSIYESARDYVVKPLIGNLDPVGNGGEIVTLDTSCWEENCCPHKHYAFSTISAINGLRSFLSLAEAQGDQATVAYVTQHIKALQIGFEASFIVDGRIKGTVEPSPIDDMNAAVIEAFNWGVVTDPSVINATVAKMSVLACAPGGWRRVTGTSNYERHEFVFIDFAMARLFLRLGLRDKAQAILDRTITRSGIDHNLIPEMYVSATGDPYYPGKIGDPTGANPMVGYGAGVYVITMLERQSPSLWKGFR